MSDSDKDLPQLPAAMPGKIFDRLFQSRTVLIHGEVDSRLAQAVTAQLLALAAVGDDPITVFIHSEGGHVEAGDSIHDIVRFVKPRVRMVGTGQSSDEAGPSRPERIGPGLVRFLLNVMRHGFGCSR